MGIKACHFGDIHTSLLGHVEEGVDSDITTFAMVLEAGIILLVTFSRIVIGVLCADLVKDVASALAKSVSQGEAYVTPIIIADGDVFAAGYKAVGNLLNLSGKVLSRLTVWGVYLSVLTNRHFSVLTGRHLSVLTGSRSAFLRVVWFNTCRQSQRLVCVNTLVCWIRPLLNGEILLYILFFVHIQFILKWTNLWIHVTLRVVWQEASPRHVDASRVGFKSVGGVKIVPHSLEPHLMRMLGDVYRHPPFHSVARGRREHQLGFEILVVKQSGLQCRYISHMVEIDAYQSRMLHQRNIRMIREHARRSDIVERLDLKLPGLALVGNAAQMLSGILGLWTNNAPKDLTDRHSLPWVLIRHGSLE